MNLLLVSLLAEVVIVMITSIVILFTTCKSSRTIQQMEREDLERRAPNRVAPEQYGGVYIPIDRHRIRTISGTIQNRSSNETSNETSNEVTKFILAFNIF